MTKFFIIVLVSILSNIEIYAQRISLDTTLLLVMNELDTNENMKFEITVPKSLCGQFFNVPLIINVADSSSIYELMESSFANGRGRLVANKKRNKAENVQFENFFHLKTQKNVYWNLEVPHVHCTNYPIMKWNLVLSYNCFNTITNISKDIKRKILIILNHTE